MPTQYANVYRNLIAHYIGLSTNGNGVAAILTETYRPLYRAVYHDCSFINTLDIILIAHYIGLSTTYSKTAGFRWIILIAHYIGLSTESSMHDLNKILLILSPIISGCLQIKTILLINMGKLIAHYIGLSTTIFSVAFH